MLPSLHCVLLPASSLILSHFLGSTGKHAAGSKAYGSEPIEGIKR